MGRKMIGTQLTFSQDQSQPYDAQRPQRLNWIRAIDLPPLPLGLALGLWVFTERDYGRTPSVLRFPLIYRILTRHDTSGFRLYTLPYLYCRRQWKSRDYGTFVPIEPSCARPLAAFSRDFSAQSW